MRTKTLGIPVDSVSSLDFVRCAFESALHNVPRLYWLCTFVNPASVILAHRQPALVEMLEHFDYVLPDGSGVAIAMRLLHHQDAARVSFDSTSLAPLVFQTAAANGMRIALCGGAPGVAHEAASRIDETFGVKPRAFDGYSDTEQTLNAIMEYDPTIVIAGMGGARQERFLLDLVAHGWRGVGFTCGGYLDQLAKRYHYYPRWVDRYNLRFAYRLWKEPTRLWRRYLLEYPLFLAWLGRDLLRRRLS